MDSEFERSFNGTVEEMSDERARVYLYEIPATMPCPEYGESVPVSFVQLVD